MFVLCVCVTRFGLAPLFSRRAVGRVFKLDADMREEHLVEVRCPLCRNAYSGCVETEAFSVVAHAIGTDLNNIAMMTQGSHR